MLIPKKALVSSRLVFCNYAYVSEEGISSPFICLSGESLFRPESKPGHREELEIKVTICSYILFNSGLTWYTVIVSPASTWRALDLVNSSRQLFRSWQRLTSSVGRFGVRWSTLLSPSRVPLGSSARAAKVAPEPVWVWAQPCQAPPCSRVGTSPLGSGVCPRLVVPSRTGRAQTSRLACPQVAGSSDNWASLWVTHQAPRSAGAGAGSHGWVHCCNQVVQVIPQRIPLHFFLSLFWVFMFSLSAVP